MNIDQLKAAGAIVSSQPIAKDITWTRTVEGKEKIDNFTINVKRRSFRDVDFFSKKREVQEQESLTANYISHFLVDENNNPCFTFDQVFDFDASFIAVLANAIQEVHKAEPAPKN